MTKLQVMQLISETKNLYDTHVKVARERLQRDFKNMTAQQIMAENIFIQDMESRSYALFLILEEIDDIEEKEHNED